MLKKYGFGLIILGVFLFGLGFWMFESGDSYWGYSSGMRTIMEFAPWFFMMLGAFGIIGGIVYLIQDIKPMSRTTAKVIEKNGQNVVLEFADGSRKNLTVLGNIAMVTGDTGTVGYKGRFIIEFKK